MPRETVLFACVENAGRSQMAAAFFNALADPSAALALSAGTDPAERVHPAVAQVMRELGLELGDAPPRHLTRDLVARADVLITMGCGAACPVVPGCPTRTGRPPTPRMSAISTRASLPPSIARAASSVIRRAAWISAADSAT